MRSGTKRDTETAMGSRGSEKSLKRIDISKQYCYDINKQIIGARGASELCTQIEVRVAEFNHVVTAPHTCLSYEHTNMRF